MYIDNKIIFVAGSTGMTGSSIVQTLLSASPTVRIRGSYRSDLGRFIKDARVEYVHADLRDRDDCARVALGCDAAVLAAATTSGARQTAEEPWRVITDNIVLEARLIEAVCLANVRRVIYVSSTTVYQEHPGAIRENELNLNIDPTSAYLGTGWVNRYAEKLGEFWHHQLGVDFLIARAANIFGPFAKFDLFTANFIPALIRKAVNKMDPFEVWGSPNVTRDVIYADDFGTAIAALLNATDVRFDAFNVGSGRRTTVGEVVDWVLRYSGHQPEQIIWHNNNLTTPSFRALDCSKIHDVTGWNPAMGIDEGVAITARWWQENQSTWAR